MVEVRKCKFMGQLFSNSKPNCSISLFVDRGALRQRLGSESCEAQVIC